MDRLLGELVLKALEPAALELSRQVAQDVEAERRQLHQHWMQRLERAHYQAERAFRQYNAVDPENRLVARTLERQWEIALAEEEALKAEHTRFLARQPPTLSAQEWAAIQTLASDIPALWHAPTTTPMDRQAIIRHLVERIIVTVQGHSEKVDVQVHWAGGSITGATLIRPVGRLEQLSYYPELLTRVATLHAEGHTGKEIAVLLNTEGWRPAKRQQAFTGPMVNDLLSRQGLGSSRPPRVTRLQRQQDEWTLRELAHEVAIPQDTLYRWMQQGRLKAHQEFVGPHPVWLIHADAAEINRLRSLRAESRHRPRSVATP